MITAAEKIRFLTLRTLGNFFILISLYGMMATFGPVVWQEINYRIGQWRGIQYVVAAYEVAPDRKGAVANLLTKDPNVRLLTPVDSNFSIIIPRIGASARIVSDVDAADEPTYLEALNQGVAHAAGTGYPGVAGDNRNIYLFAHSTDYFFRVPQYNAIFYLIKELVPGDEVDVFYQGQRHVYTVTDKKIVGAKDVEYLTIPTQEEQLTLQTCWPPGTTLKRLLVFAKPKSVVEAHVDTTVN